MSEINNKVEKSENTNESNGLKELLNVETQVEIVGATKCPKLGSLHAPHRGRRRPMPPPRPPPKPVSGKNIRMITKHLQLHKRHFNFRGRNS